MELSSHNSVAVLAFPPIGGYPRLTAAVFKEIDDLLHEVKGTGLFSAVVIAASAKSFATGADIEEVATLEGIRAREFAERGQRTCQRLTAFSLPVVAAIRGFCLGGGLDLALACHGRVATYDSSFGHPGAALGIDIGKRSPAVPVTPPYVRVRIRRFGGLSDYRTVNLGIPSESK